MNFHKKVVATIFMVSLPLSGYGDGLLGGDSNDKRVEKRLKDLEFNYTILDGGDYKLTFNVDDNRSQLVFIDSDTEEYRDFEVREVYSPAYKSANKQFPIEVANKLLEASRTIKLGGWVKDGEYAIFVARISANADSESLKSTIKLVVEAADEMEKELTKGEDNF